MNCNCIDVIEAEADQSSYPANADLSWNDIERLLRRLSPQCMSSHIFSTHPLQQNIVEY